MNIENLKSAFEKVFGENENTKLFFSPGIAIFLMRMRR